MGNAVRRQVVRAAAGALAALALAAAPAVAAPAFGGTAFFTPGNGSNLFYDTDSGSGSLTVAGTVANPSASARGDLRCYNGVSGGTAVLATNIDVSSGRFAFNVSLAPAVDQVCRLALVPSGTASSASAPAAYGGPAISVTGRQSDSWNGELYGYSILAGTFSQSFSLGSAGECAVRASYMTTSASAGSYTLFDRAGCLGPAVPGAPRSELQVDGVNGYLPGAVGPTTNSSGTVTSPGLTAQPGFAPLAYTASFSAAHDTVDIEELEAVMLCNAPAGYPATPSSCPSLRDSGIRLLQHTTLVTGDSVVRVADTFADVDGQAHHLDLDYEQGIGDTNRTSGAPGFQFPGQGVLVSRASPDSFSGWVSGPQSIFVIRDASAAPSATNPVGAITFGQPPASARFTSASGAGVAELLMEYGLAIPADRSLTLNWAYSQATSAGAATLIEAAERDRLQSPGVLIGAPKNHLRTGSGRVTVSGVVADGVGVKSMTLAGRPVPIAGGRFSTSVALFPGTNRIVATATNVAGNPSSASVTVTRLVCRVPKLAGATLSAAKRALKRADCGLGKTSSRRSRTVRKGRVLSSSPKSGAIYRPGEKVRLALSRGR